MNPPLIIVTGFLGSGKTTFLRRALGNELQGRRVGLIVNEIGAIGFDGRALAGLAQSGMVELTEGCICCTMGSDFLFAIEDLIDAAHPELILIETTGLAEPGGMLRQARAAGLALDTVITLVDALHWQQGDAASPIARWQVRAADIVLLTKCDIATADEIAQAQAWVRQENRRAAIFRSPNDHIPLALVTTPVPHQPPPADTPDHSAHLASDGIATFLWESDEPCDRERISSILRTLPPQIYRVKGHIHCRDAPWAVHVHVVCGRVELTDVRMETPKRLNQLVFIGSEIEQFREEVVQQLYGNF